MEPALDWWGALQCFLGPLFSILSALPAEVSPLLFLYLSQMSPCGGGGNLSDLAGKRTRERSCCPWRQGHKQKALEGESPGWVRWP